MGVVTKRSSMVFYSDPTSQYSHRVRIVLAEKGVAVEIVNVDADDIPEEVNEYNPYGTLPTLVDRDLSLFEPNIMMEYLDERFPHPPLLPVYPVARAQARLAMHRIQTDWCELVDQILDDEDADAARRELAESILSAAPLFAEKPYFFSDDFSVMDCCVAPVLWRLESLGLRLPEKPAKPIYKYMDRVFSRESFKASLSEIEADMRR